MSGIEVFAVMSIGSLLLAIILGIGAFVWVPVMCGLGWAASSGW